MHRCLIAILFLFTTAVLFAAEPRIVLHPVAGNLSVAMDSTAGHQTPVQEFFRRYERVFRQTGRFSNNRESKPLILQLSLAQKPGTCQFVYSKQFKCKVLQLPLELKSILHSPQIGRRLTMALLQSRMGNNPEQAFPREAWWIADGIWANFVQREIQNFPIMHFTYLPGLRNLAEKGFRMKLDQDILMPPATVQPNAPDFVLYTQRAQLMVEIARFTAAGKQSNLLKDYYFLLTDRRMSPADCFSMIFAQAAQRKLNIPEAPNAASLPPAQRFLPGYAALEKIALRTLFTGYAPMAPEALLARFDLINQVVYKPEKSPNQLRGVLSDLPTIIQNNRECQNLTAQKISELNDLALLAPLQLRDNILKLAIMLNQIDLRRASHSSNKIRQQTAVIRREIIALQQIDRELQGYETDSQVFLYPMRYSIGNVLPEKPLTIQIKKFMDRYERQLMQ